MVEAAIVFPLIILIIAGFVSVSFELYARVEKQAAANRQDAVEKLENTELTTEDILRGVWIVD